MCGRYFNNVAVWMAFIFVVVITDVKFVSAFTAGRFAKSKSSSLRMGFFDGLQKAFSNESYSAPPEGKKATARHILVKSLEEVDEVLGKVAEGKEGFASIAAAYSSCPSGSRGGSLGSFSPGTMVKEFDEVCFSPETKIGEIVGPIEVSYYGF